MSNQPRFKFFSRAILSTCVVDLSNQVVFDAGAALPFIITPKFRKIFITHCDPDHICGLFPYALLLGKEKVSVFVPLSYVDMLTRWSREFNIENIEITGVEDGKEIPVSKNAKIVVIRVKHSEKEAVAFLLKQKIRKLLPEFAKMTSQQISTLVKKGTRVTSEEWINDVVYTGDLDRESLEKLPSAKFLISETTYPNGERELADKHGHLCEEDVARVAAKYDHVIKIHESLGHYDKPHKNAYVERINLGEYEG